MTVQSEAHIPSSASDGTPPRVSVGMPAYNAAPFVAAAIEAVLAQTFADFELIVCDNASTDDTVAICERYTGLDSRVRLLRNGTNLGAHPNYRKAADAARGTYFKWASANDLIAANFLGECVRTLDAHPDAVLAFGSTVLFEIDPALGTPYADEMNLLDDDALTRFRRCTERLQLNNILNGVLRLDALRAIQPLADYRGADNLLIAKLALLGKFIEVPQTQFYRRMSAASATRLQGAQAVHRHLYAGRSKGGFENWKLARGYLHAVISSRLPPGKRLAAFAYILRQTYWRAPDLAADVRDAFRSDKARDPHTE